MTVLALRVMSLTKASVLYGSTGRAREAVEANEISVSRKRVDSPKPTKNSRANLKYKHCKRTNHDSKDCKACFNCLKLCHFRKERKAPKQNSLK